MVELYLFKVFVKSITLSVCY